MKILLLTGSPIASSLDWSETALSSTALPCFFNLEPNAVKPISKQQVVAPLWRFLPLTQRHLPTGLTQASQPQWNSQGATYHNEPSLASTAGRIILNTADSLYAAEAEASAQTVEEVLSEYYDHSFAVHDVASSQIKPPGSLPTSIADDSDDVSIESDFDHYVDAHVQVIHSRLSTEILSDLTDIPNASYLRAITPQTMTVNLVFGIISISRPRTIMTRRHKQEVQLVDMIVGDETRSGFGINIWLPMPHTPDSNASVARKLDDASLRSQTLGLRPQDVVFARNLALGSFRGNVDGQSLRRGMTTLDLVYRNPVDAEDPRGAFKARELDDASTIDPNLRKVKRVKEWVTDFVGTRRRSGKKVQHEHLSSLPADTP